MMQPDIANPARIVGKFCEKPGAQHKKTVENILQYVLRAPDKRITNYG